MGWFYDLKQHGTPSTKEWKHFIIVILVLGFIAGFNDRSGNGIGIEYLWNMLTAILIIGFSIIFANLVSRIHTAIIGYKSQYHFSINGLLIGVMLAFVSNGYFWYFAPGYHIINMNETGRLGHFRYGLRMKDWSRAAASGSFAYILLALIAHLSAPGNPAVDFFVKINIVLGLYSMFPVPENNGINIFFGQRSLYFFELFAMIAVIVLMRFMSSFWMIMISGAILGGLGLLIWISKYDHMA